MIKKILKLKDESGLKLSIIRMPLKIIKVLLDKLTKYYYSMFLAQVGKNFYIEFGAYIASPKSIKLGDNVYIGKGVTILAESQGGGLVVGNNVEFGRCCRIDITGNLTIKDNVLFSRGCQVSTHTHGYNPKNAPVGCDLLIESGVWLGADCFVMDGCNFIAKNSLLATRAVITKDLTEKNSIWAGIPCKKIGNIND